MAGTRPLDSLDDRAPRPRPEENIEEAQSQDLECFEDKKARVSDASDAGGEELEDAKPDLPFSKARCIALVATLTGASFLNVCQRHLYEGFVSNAKIT